MRGRAGSRRLSFRGELRFGPVQGGFDNGRFDEFDESRFSCALSSSMRAVSLAVVAVKPTVKFAIASVCDIDRACSTTRARVVSRRELGHIRDRHPQQERAWAAV